MPRVALSLEQKKEYKLKDFKGWVVKQMRLNHKTQEDVGKALGISGSRVSQMLKIPDPKKDKGKRITADPFSYGQVLILCELFNVTNVTDEEILKLMRM